MTDRTPQVQTDAPAPALFNTPALDPELLPAVADSGYLAMMPIR
jgi:hypothetical protein